MGKKWWIIGTALAAAFFLSQTAQDPAALPVFSQSQQTVPTLATTFQSEVEFPFVLRGTGLILQNLARYDGLFPEGEEEYEVIDAAALMVYNPGKEWVRSVKILLTQGTQDYIYEITCLPPNSRVLVVEKNGQRFSGAPVESCRCLSLSVSEESLFSEQVGIRELPSGLAVKNLTGGEISRLTVYHKQYVADGDFYLGGYTCQKELTALAAGEEREVEVYRYVPGYSRVVALEWKK